MLMPGLHGAPTGCVFNTTGSKVRKASQSSKTWGIKEAIWYNYNENQRNMFFFLHCCTFNNSEKLSQRQSAHRYGIKLNHRLEDNKSRGFFATFGSPGISQGVNKKRTTKRKTHRTVLPSLTLGLQSPERCLLEKRPHVSHVEARPGSRL